MKEALKRLVLQLWLSNLFPLRWSFFQLWRPRWAPKGPSLSADGNAKWCGCFGNEPGSSWKIKRRAALLLKVNVALSCQILCDPMDYTAHGVLQARILEWEAFPFSRGSSQPRGWTQVSCVAGSFLPAEPQGSPRGGSVAQSCPTHALQHARLPCPSLSPRVFSNSCPLSWWCYLTVSSSAAPSFAFNLSLHQGLFQRVAYDPTILLLGIYPKRNGNIPLQKNLYTGIH